ncbi:MAG: hypothetical protein ABF298_03095, partial [Alteriqipengyuania sp.]
MRDAGHDGGGRRRFRQEGPVVQLVRQIEFAAIARDHQEGDGAAFEQFDQRGRFLAVAMVLSATGIVTVNLISSGNPSTIAANVAL